MPGGTALFGSAATGPGSTGGNKHLVEMRAGKMNLKGRMVCPDKRKGLLYVYQSEDSLMHFCWQDRTTGVVEDDLIIFPDDCEYLVVPQCATGRVYLLKFKSSTRKFFFWLQEPSEDKDQEHCKRINELLNNPSSAVQSSQGPDQDLQSLLNSMSQSQLMQFFGGVGQMGTLSSILGTIRGPGSGSARTTTPAITHRATSATTTTSSTPATTTTATPPRTPQNSSTAPTTTTDAPKKATNAPPATTAPAIATTESPTATAAAAPSIGQRIELSDFQNFLNNFMQNQPNQGGGAAGAQQQSVDLSTALNAEALSGILYNSPGALEALQSHLPAVEGTNPQETLRSTLASPQFQQAVSQFSSALESGQLGPVVSQLSVNPEAVAAAASGNMAEFVRALEKGAPTEDNKDAKDKKKDDDEEQMQLD